MCNFRLINRNICEKLNSHAFSLGHVTPCNVFSEFQKKLHRSLLKYHNTPTNYTTKYTVYNYNKIG